MRRTEKTLLMNIKNALLYYKDVRPSNLRSERYRHLFLLLFWPIYGLVFMSLERIVPIVYRTLVGEELIYHEVVSVLDGYIPFCEAFVIPYYFWFALLVGMVFYALLFDIRAFREYMWFVILTYTITSVIYMVYPNMQALRPTEFARDNLFVDIVKYLYEFDTNTNVCPSIHVLGTLAVCIPCLRGVHLHAWGWKVFFWANAVLISVSTVFLKQHSILDVFAALILFALCYPLVYGVFCRRKKADAKKADDPKTVEKTAVLDA